jgi:hypothetical protein
MNLNHRGVVGIKTFDFWEVLIGFGVLFYSFDSFLQVFYDFYTLRF